MHDAGGVGAHIGALVVEVAIINGEDPSLIVDGSAQAVELLARMIGGHQMLAAVLDPFHRPVESHRRDTDQHIFRIELAADAEASADVGFVYVDRGRRAFEHPREQLAIAVRHLGGAMQFEGVACYVIAPDRTARLERHTGMAPDRQFELNDLRCGVQDRVDVAVALADNGHLSAAAGGEFGGLGVGGEQDRQFLDLEGDKFSRVFRHVGIISENRGDRLADIPHLLGGEYRLAIGLERRNLSLAEVDRRYVSNIGRGPHRDDSSQGTRSRGVDRGDFAVGMVGANDPHVQLMRKRDIASETAAPANQGRILESRDGSPDPLVGSFYRRALVSAIAARLRLLKPGPRVDADGHAAACSSARRVTVRARSRRYVALVTASSSGSTADATAAEAASKTERSAGCPARARSASAMRRGCGSTPPMATRGSQITPSCRRKVTSAMPSAKSPARRLNS